tara:strand:- start:910 stop:1107 length:198 start_codon:yes stop_codon:yes gene_type:complete
MSVTPTGRAHCLPDMDGETQAAKVMKIKLIEELDGYESAAKLRGILPEELLAIHQRRKALTPKNR